MGAIFCTIFKVKRPTVGGVRKLFPTCKTGTNSGEFVASSHRLFSDGNDFEGESLIFRSDFFKLNIDCIVKWGSLY